MNCAYYKRDIRNRLFLRAMIISSFFVVGGMLLVCGCGGSDELSNDPGDTVETQSKVPAISNLFYTPLSATQYEGGGSIDVEAIVDFIDHDKDIVSVKIAIGGVDALDVPTPGSSGSETGVLYVKVMVSTLETGSQTFSIRAVDSEGHESNKLYGTFSVN